MSTLGLRVIRRAASTPGLRALCELRLTPAQFVGQHLQPHVAGLLVDPESAERVHVAHRKVCAVTQIREELDPGDLLLRDPDCRDHWTLAVPPLLAPHSNGGRIVTVLVEDQLSPGESLIVEERLRERIQSHGRASSCGPQL